MFATVQDLYNAVQLDIGDQGGIFINMIDVIQWYNEAIVDIYVNAELGRDTPKSYPLIAGNKTLDVMTGTPPDLTRLQKVHNFVINGRPLKQTNLAELYETVGYNIDFDFRGQPLYYWRENDTFFLGDSVLKFWPACEVDCTAILSATILPEPIARNTSEATTTLDQIPLVYHKDILTYVVMRGHQKERDFRAAELKERVYQEGASARFDNAHEVAEEFSTIRPDPVDLAYGDLF